MGLVYIYGPVVSSAAVSEISSDIMYTFYIFWEVNLYWNWPTPFTFLKARGWSVASRTDRGRAAMRQRRDREGNYHRTVPVRACVWGECREVRRSQCSAQARKSRSGPTATHVVGAEAEEKQRRGEREGGGERPHVLSENKHLIKFK